MIHTLFSLLLLTTAPTAIPLTPTSLIKPHQLAQREARRAERSATHWLGWAAWGAALVLFSAAVSWWVLGGFVAFVGGTFGGGWLRRLWRGVRRSIGVLGGVLMLSQAGLAQDFVSPFSFVVSDKGTDIYHTPVQVSISAAGQICIGSPSEDAQPAVLRYTATPNRIDSIVTYNTDQGTVVHATDRLGESVTWYGNGFIFRLYSFIPSYIKIQK